MYIPKHHHHLYPLLTFMAGFYIKQRYGSTPDVWMTAICLHTAGLMHAYYIVRAGIMYQAYITNAPPPRPVITNWHTGEIVPDIDPPVEPGFIPMGRAGSVPVVNNQVVALPKFDKERNFAVTLLRMHEYDPDKDPDMTERKWVKTTKKFVRGEFVSMLSNWEGHGVIERKTTTKNSPYIVRRWDAVKLIANGNPLPR